MMTYDDRCYIFFHKTEICSAESQNAFCSSGNIYHNTIMLISTAKSVMVELQSSDSKATIKVNGRDISKDDRGFNIVILDYTTGNVQSSESFNTQNDGGSAKAMANFLSALKPATIVLVASKGDPNVDMTDDAYDELVSCVRPDLQRNTKFFFPRRIYYVNQHLALFLYRKAAG